MSARTRSSWKWGAEKARLAAEAVRACGGVEAFLKHLERVAGIRTACRRMSREYPDVPILTLHDCLCTTAPHVDLVERVMREAFPVPVTLKRQSWDSRAGQVEERLDGESCKEVAR
jgi:hypothetical protein